MRIKKITALTAAVSIIMSIISSIPVLANYSENTGTYTWDFAEFADTGEWNGTENTGEAITKDYNGLTISIIDETQTDHDKVTSSGVYWRTNGTPNTEKTEVSPRYIAYTATEAGTLYATGKIGKSSGRWGIHTDLKYAFNAANSSTSTSQTTVSMTCEAGVTYYIYGKTHAVSVTEVKFVSDNAEVPEETTEPSNTSEPEEPSEEDPGFVDPDEDGIYEWDFSKYTSEWSGVSETEATDTFISDKYNGLVVSIARQDRTDRDKITSDGAYWSGYSNVTGRYILIEPPEDGILVVEGDKGSWKVAASTDGASMGTTKIKCTAGTKYYIVPTANGTRINHIQYITNRASLPATASLNNMYGDNMLLQRGKPIKLDGFAEYSTAVTVALTNDNNSADTQSVESQVESDKWNVTLDAVSNYTDTYTLTIAPTGDETASETVTTTVNNIKFGDLYLCGGQSNMQWYLKHYFGTAGYPEYKTDDYTSEEIDACATGDIRILQLPNSSEGSQDTTHSKHCESLTVDGVWRELDSSFVYDNYLPATVYSIATKLHSETDVPIGILSTAVGGTTIAQWLENTGIDSYNKNKNWYNGRIYPLRNFAISGIFWYQGCSDKDNGEEYYEKRMTELINSYRNLFGDNQLPFYYVQLARNAIVYPDTTSKEGEDNTGMRDVRAAQTNVYLNMADKTNLGFISTLDIYGTKEYKGSTKNVNSNARVNYHTGQKPLIAQRLVDLALKDIYNKDTHKDGTTVYTHGPLYKSHYANGNELIVEFETNGNLKVMDAEQYADNHSQEVWTDKGIDTDKIQEFEIAGADGEYYSAQAEISGSRLILTSDKVSAPVSVRYAYSPYPECPNLTDDSNLPAYAFTAEAAKEYEPVKFDFGTGETNEGFTRVSTTDCYSDEKGYGFLGISEESADYTAVVDGYDQRNGNYTVLTAGEDYVKSSNKQYPIRFAIKAEPNSYYKVKVTMSAQGGDAEVFLTSERRHFILTNESIADGNTLTKEFTVGVHNVRWKNRDSGKAVTENYTDDMLNIGLLGKNAALNSIEIQRISKPKVLWIFGDSTVTDHVAEVPVSSLADETGWGAAAAKYVNDDVAVVNLSEGGLSTADTAYFDLGKNDIGAGDVVLMQFGHNENQSSASTYTSNLDYYCSAAANAGAKLVICSPIQRLEAGNQNGPWASTGVDTVYPEAAKSYAESHTGAEYIALNEMTRNLNESLGIKAWYLHRAYWKVEGSGAEPTAQNDPTHLNDCGADQTCRMAMMELAKITTGYVRENMSDALMPSEFIMKNGSDEYVMPPYKGNEEVFPYPAEADFDHEVEISGEVFDENGVLSSIKVKRNTTLLYITVFAASYDENGMLVKLASKRLEPASAGAEEVVEFSDEDNITLPQNGKIGVFVWDGAFIDNTMTMKPLSENYRIDKQ